MKYRKLFLLVIALLIVLGGCGKSAKKKAKDEKTEGQSGVVTHEVENVNTNPTGEPTQHMDINNNDPNQGTKNYKFYLGKKEGKKYKSGYSGKHEIDKKDPHYGWDLGNFYVTGYTSQTVDSEGRTVFLKTIGDEIVLNFELKQDIDKLNNRKDLSIAADKRGTDKYFGIKETNFGRGMLIIQHTDYQNKVEDPILYSDYLKGVSAEAETKAILLEEGDYKVCLDYRIRDDDLVADDYYDYCIFFTFSIRNGNCMAFPFDVKTGDELLNCAYTENGFYLDLANSHYLDIFVKRETYADGADGLTEDVRFNGPAKEGYEYRTEGIYTITVKNPYINEPTIKVIYVGTNPMLKAYVVNGISISEIKAKLNQGYTINDDGTFNDPPKITATPTPSVEEIIEKQQPTSEPSDEGEAVKFSPEPSQEVVQNKDDERSGGIIDIILCLVIIGVVAGLVFFIWRRADDDSNTRNNRE